MVVMLGTTLVGLELAVRLLPLEAFSDTNLVRLDDHPRWVGHPYMAYAPRPGWRRATPGRATTHNSLGFRGPEISREKPPGTFRVVCLGGSSTYGHTPSSDEATWPFRLQELLGEVLEQPVEVVNAGASGHTSHESLVKLGLDLLDLDPDLVLVYHSLNDVRAWTWPGFKPDNSHYRAVWPERVPYPGKAWLEQSRAFLAVRRYVFGVDPRQDLNAWIVRDWDHKRYLRTEFQKEGPRAFRRNLEHIVALCRFRSVGVVLGQQACVLDDLGRSSDREGMARARTVIASVGRELEVPVCDLPVAMPPGRELFTRDVHLTDAGADRLARTWAGFLRRQDGLLPSRR